MPMYNSFPATYNNPYYQQQPIMQQQQMAQQPVSNNSIIWVQGEAGAKSYLVAPNTTVQLWDSESQKIYLKSADASGMPSIKTLEYTILSDNSSIQTIPIDEDKYISRDEFDALKGKIESLQGEINRLKPHKKEEKHHE